MFVKKCIKLEFIFYINFFKFFNFIDLFIKDIVSVFVNGYVIIWFEVDNLGVYLCVIIVWIIYCIILVYFIN